MLFIFSLDKNQIFGQNADSNFQFNINTYQKDH